MAITFDEFDTPTAPSGSSPQRTALTFEDEPKEDNAGIVGNTLMGALSGAANIGSNLLLPVDWARDKLSGDREQTLSGLVTGKAPESRNEERKRLIKEFFAQYADPESLAFKGGELGTEVAGTLGVGGGLAKGVRAVAPSLVKLPAALESFGGSVGTGATTAERLANAGIRVGAGAAAGGTAGLLVDPEGADTGAVVGGAMPVVGKAASIGAQGLSWLADAVRGRLGAIQAGKIARDAAGNRRIQIERANAAAPGDITAAQAAEGIDRDVWQALGKLAEKNDPNSYYRMLADQQEGNRRAALAAVTPDLDAALAAREMVDNLHYPIANRAPVAATPQLAQMAGDPYFQRAAQNMENYLTSSGITFRNNPTEFLQAIKFGLDDMLRNGGENSVRNTVERRAIEGVRSNLINWLENANPAYRYARQGHAANSAPVNQAQVLNELQAVLQRTGGGERVTPFLNVMGSGENALLRRANQSPRFGGIEDVLTPPQMDAYNRVAGELIRDRNLAEQAAAGEGGLRNILRADEGLPRLPSYLSIVASTTNKAISKLEERISQGTIRAIVAGMRSGANANKLLATVPTSERDAAAMWIIRGGPQRYLGAPTAGQAADSAGSD